MTILKHIKQAENPCHDNPMTMMTSFHGNRCPTLVGTTNVDGLQIPVVQYIFFILRDNAMVEYRYTAMGL